MSLLTACASPPDMIDADGINGVPVVHVVDGDTIIVQLFRAEHTVRPSAEKRGRLRPVPPARARAWVMPSDPLGASGMVVMLPTTGTLATAHTVTMDDTRATASIASRQLRTWTTAGAGDAHHDGDGRPSTPGGLFPSRPRKTRAITPMLWTTRTTATRQTPTIGNRWAAGVASEWNHRATCYLPASAGAILLAACMLMCPSLSLGRWLPRTRGR